MSLTLRADRSLLRAGARSRRFLCATVEAPDAAARPGRSPVNLAFVLDRSGSMHREKIARAREAVLQGIRSLREGDRFAVVAYDEHVETVVGSTAATAAARQAAARAVAGIDARGQTDLAGGWLRGCELVKEALSSEAVGRALLLTDGLANVGTTEPDEIVRQVAEWRDRGVTTTAFGVGADFDETLLRRMADAGGGSFRFIESAVQVPDFVASEVGEALAVTARDAALVVEAGPGAVVESVNEFRVRQDGEAWRVELGSLFAGQALDALVRVTFPEGEAGAHRDVVVRLEDVDGALGRETASLRFTWASHEENDRQPRLGDVERLVAAAYAARAERDALERNRARDFRGARAVLEACARRIASYAGDDAVLRGLVEDLEAKAGRYGRDMDPVLRKTLHSLSSGSLKGRFMERERRRHGAPPRVSLLCGWELSSTLQVVGRQLARADRDLFGDVFVDGLHRGLDESGATLDPSAEAVLLAEVLRQAVPSGVHVLFTLSPLSTGWFSHWHPDRRAAVVSVAGWEAGILGPSLEAFLAYEGILHGLRTLGDAWTPEALLHEETRGCLFDACTHKTDVQLKLQAGDLCPSCRGTLEAAGAPLRRIERLAAVVRLLAAPAGVVH